MASFDKRRQPRSPSRRRDIVPGAPYRKASAIAGAFFVAVVSMNDSNVRRNQNGVVRQAASAAQPEPKARHRAGRATKKPGALAGLRAWLPRLD